MVPIDTALRWSFKLAAWATPQIRAWSLERSLSRVEGERHLKARNWGEAENQKRGPPPPVKVVT